MIEYDREKMAQAIDKVPGVFSHTHSDILDAIEAVLGVEKKAPPQLPEKLQLKSAERNWESADMQDWINDILAYLQHYAPLLEELATRE